MTSIQYFPVYSNIDTNLKLKNKRLSFLHDDSIFFHPNFLISYAYRPKKIIKDFISKNTVMMGDSGGYQALTLNKEFTPEEVIKWQNENCYYGMTLDKPPLNKVGYLDDENIRKCMNISNINANKMMGLKDTKLKLGLVVQGNTDKNRQMWYENGMKEYNDWDFYSICPKPFTDLWALADFILWAKKNNLKNIHVLGRAGLYDFPILIYMNKYFNRISCDSSYFCVGSIYRKYYYPYKAGTHFYLWSDKELPLTSPCDCPVCSNIDNMEIFRTNLAPDLIDLHNIYQIKRYINELESLSYRKDLFMNFIPKKSKEVIEYLDFALLGNNQWRF